MDSSIYDEIFSNPRTFNEILISLIALRIGTIAAYGHLNTLRKEVRPVRHVLLFIVLPTLPLAELIMSFWQSFRIAWKGTDGEFKDVQYLVAVALQLRATDIDDERESKPLSELDYLSLQWEGVDRDWEWTGRLLVLMVLLAQSLAATIIWIRRVSRSFPAELPDAFKLNELRIQYGIHLNPDYVHFNSVSSFDGWSGAYAIGGLSTVLTSIGITCLNQKWRYTRSFQDELNLPLRLNREMSISFALFWGINYRVVYILVLSQLMVIKSAFKERTFFPGIFSLVCTVQIAFMVVLNPLILFFIKKSRMSFLGGPFGHREELVMYSWSFTLTLVFVVLDLLRIVHFQQDGNCAEPFVLWKDSWSDKMLMY